jgi:ABC-type Fe3+-citrate transport system substrate-binding protein
MLINQNHEMSIKLKKKDENIDSLKMTMQQNFEENKVSERSSSEYNNEDSYAGNYK